MGKQHAYQAKNKEYFDNVAKKLRALADAYEEEAAKIKEEPIHVRSMGMMDASFKYLNSGLKSLRNAIQDREMGIEPHLPKTVEYGSMVAEEKATSADVVKEIEEATKQVTKKAKAKKKTEKKKPNKKAN